MLFLKHFHFTAITITSWSEFQRRPLYKCACQQRKPQEHTQDCIQNYPEVPDFVNVKEPLRSFVEVHRSVTENLSLEENIEYKKFLTGGDRSSK